MKHVRTVRSYEALTVTEGSKTYTVTAAPQEVSDEAAKAIEKAADQAGVRVEVSDEAPELATATFVGSSIAPDLSRGIGSISGHGAPVETFAAADAGTPADQEAPAPGADAQGDGTPSSTTTTTTTTKGK